MVRLPFWEHLTESEKINVLNQQSRIHYRKGVYLDGGCSCLGMIHVIHGIIRAFLLSEEGREITLFRITGGEICVLSAFCMISQAPPDVHFVAEVDTEILLIPSAVFTVLVQENIYLKCFMYELLTERFSSALGTLQQVLFKRTDCRLAEYLLEQYRRTGSAKIKITQEQLAVNINSVREVVARTLKRFSEQGILELHRGMIYIKDISSLEETERR